MYYGNCHHNNALSIGQAAALQVVRSVKRFIADDHDKDIVFSGKLRLKDASYGVELAHALGVDSEFGQMAVDTYARTGKLGLDDQNETAVIGAVGRKSPQTATMLVAPMNG